MTFQFFGSETSRVNLSRSRRMTLITVSLASAENGLTGAITAVLIPAFPFQRPRFSPLMSGAGRRRGRYGDRRQDLVQVVTAHLEPGRQAERRAQLFGRLVDRESRSIRGDFEKHATRLTEIDGFEIPAVDDGRDVAAGSEQEVAPGHLLGWIMRTPRDMVHGSDRLFAFGSLRRLDDVDDRVRPARPRLEANQPAFLVRLAKAHRIGQQADSRRRLRHCQRHRVEAADRVISVDWRLLPGDPPVVSRIAGQCELDPVRVMQDDKIFAETTRTR